MSTDPDWPCIQRRVDHLSAGAMWPFPMQPDTAIDIGKPEKELAGKLSLRRVSEQEAHTLVADFLTRHPDMSSPAALGAVFNETVARIDQYRGKILRGIVRYARKQHALSKEIDGLRNQMLELSRAEPQDFDKIDEVEETLDWSERIFVDRNHALTYVCESPVLLEKHAFSMARILAEFAQE